MRVSSAAAKAHAGWMGHITEMFGDAIYLKKKKKNEGLKWRHYGNVTLTRCGNMFGKHKDNCHVDIIRRRVMNAPWSHYGHIWNHFEVNMEAS